MRVRTTTNVKVETTTDTRAELPANGGPPVIAVVGGMFMDLVFETDRVPERGESLDAKSLVCTPGGKASNTALAIDRAQRLRPLIEIDMEHPGHTTSARFHAKSLAMQDSGVRVRLNTAVGDDYYGKQLRENLRQNGLDDSGVWTIPNQATGICVKFVETNRTGSRGMRFPGASAHWTPQLMVLESLAGRRKPDLLVCNFEVKMETAFSLLESAATEGIETVLNPSPAPVHGFGDSVYQNVTHLVLDTVEASKLLQQDRMAVGEDPFWASQFGLQELKHWRRASQVFLDKGVKNVVMLDGDNGAFYASKEGRGFVEAEMHAEARDTTVAADTFLGVYALEIVRQRPCGQWDITKAVQRACKAAARTMTGCGSQGPIPWADESDTSCNF